jgi:hypothetical protein
MSMSRHDLVADFLAKVPSVPQSHIMWWLMSHLATGAILPFMRGLLDQLILIDSASPGYAQACVRRVAAIPGITDQSLEALYQVVGEVYCAGGAVEVADRDANGSVIFTSEPFADAGLMNPEFDSQHKGISYSVEVKTPGLIAHRRARGTNQVQLTTRLPANPFADEAKTLPRDNPVKDFLISANRKFAAYATQKSEPYRILAIVWDNFVYEPITALMSPVAGLFTERSFHRTANGDRMTYPHLDGVVIIPYQNQILNSFCNNEIGVYEADDFLCYRAPVLPKAFIQCPDGREVPEQILTALDATPLAACLGTEYRPQDIIIWTGGG